MAKKRGKSKAGFKKRIRKPKAAKSGIEAAEAKKPVGEALHELEILAEEKKVEQEIGDIEKREDSIAIEEKKIEKETEKVEKLEKEVKEEIAAKPLTKFNLKDLNRGIIGAFIGVVAHFSFISGKEIATQITTTRATVLIIFSYLLIMILMYETGYREIKEKRLLKIFPKRATLIYLTSIGVIVVIFFLFNQASLSDLMGFYKQIAVTSILASLGAGTADLLGRD